MYKELKYVGAGHSISKVETPLDSIIGTTLKIDSPSPVELSDDGGKCLVIMSRAFSNKIIEQVCIFPTPVFSEICKCLETDTTIEIELDGIPIPIHTRNIQMIS